MSNRSGSGSGHAPSNSYSPTSMTALLNTSGLEQILLQFQTRLNEQQSTIDFLTTQLDSNSMSSNSFKDWKKSVDDRLTSNEKRLDRIEQLTHQLPQIMKDVQEHNATLTHHQHKLSDSISKSDFSTSQSRSQDEMRKAIDELVANKADKSSFSALESSQHALVIQNRSLQQLLSSKVDEAQLPTLLDEQNRLKSILDKQTNIDKRMKQLEIEVKSTLNDLDLSVNDVDESKQLESNNNNAILSSSPNFTPQQSVNQTQHQQPQQQQQQSSDGSTPRTGLPAMATVVFRSPRTIRSIIKDIEHELSCRPTISYLDSTVIQPVQRFSKHIAAVSGKHAKLDNMLSEHAVMRSTVTKFDTEMASIHSTAESIHQLHHELNDRLAKCITEQRLTEVLKHHSKSMQIHQSQSQAIAMHQIELNFDKLEQLKDDIQQMKSCQNKLYESCKLSEKFIDWFTEVRTNKATFSALQ